MKLQDYNCKLIAYKREFKVKAAQNCTSKILIGTKIFSASVSLIIDRLSQYRPPERAASIIPLRRYSSTFCTFLPGNCARGDAALE